MLFCTLLFFFFCQLITWSFTCPRSAVTSTEAPRLPEGMGWGEPSCLPGAVCPILLPAGDGRVDKVYTAPSSISSILCVSLSVMSDSATPWTVAHQAPLSSQSFCLSLRPAVWGHEAGNTTPSFFYPLFLHFPITAWPSQTTSPPPLLLTPSWAATFWLVYAQNHQITCLKVRSTYYSWPLFQMIKSPSSQNPPFCLQNNVSFPRERIPWVSLGTQKDPRWAKVEEVGEQHWSISRIKKGLRKRCSKERARRLQGHGDVT